ncbi:3-oxoacyl-[acyl-carrier-protein] synthase III C-terminal domain-containing protein [Streptomyces sp. AS02]|uniref:3-oxoacyl-[acyl-carrier-protein] synthase III C-terminal domain-containing protein n=1 Tax=Streptomyces sp. AS02 TaxID=2938946 RepID=UPI002020CB75|nr:3-oxoacyl-[acyl-carrier-protein] synthase III C-terminal domain-containing protein [Streptomyces sp. AS02]MCL8015542.1 3-oxoacyl-ACP synthase [Streptomyces sp. AS02]
MTPRLGTLERIESALPDRTVVVEAMGKTLGLSRAKLSLFRKVHGLQTLRLDPGLSLVDLVLSAARGVVTGLADPLRVRYVIHARAIHQVAPAGTDIAREVRDALGLGHAEAFAVTQQNCASGLGAIEVAAALLAGGDPADRALVLTGEKPFCPQVQLVPNTAIMGEAAAACLVAAEGTGHPVLSLVSRTLGEYADLISLPAEEAARFGKAYAPTLADVIRQAVAEAGLSLGDIDLIIPHNVNLMSWRQTIAELDIPAERVFLDNIARYSHCFTSDVFVNYTTLRDDGRLAEGRHYLMAGVGAGATFSAAVLTYRGAR